MKKKYIILILFIVGIFGTLSIALNKYSNSYKNIEPKNNIKVEKIGYLISGENISINYPIFIKNKNTYIEEIKKGKLNKNINSIQITNINSDSFIFLKELSSIYKFQYYDFKFDNYLEKYDEIFDYIESKNGIIELDLFFNVNGNNINLLNALKKIKLLSDKDIEYIMITGSNEFVDNYYMTKEQFDLIHNNNFFSIYLDLNIGKDIDDAYIINYLKKSKVEEYHLFNKFTKIRGKITNIEGIQKTSSEFNKQ